MSAPPDPNKRFIGSCRRHGPNVPLFISDKSCCACRAEQIRARRAAERARRGKRSPRAREAAQP
jgi:hypothetical protein